MNRLEMARAIMTEAKQAEVSCPFLGAISPETRITLGQQHPNPHDLPKAELLEIAAQHGFTSDTPKTLQIENVDSFPRRGVVRYALTTQTANDLEATS